MEHQVVFRFACDKKLRLRSWTLPVTPAMTTPGQLTSTSRQDHTPYGPARHGSYQRLIAQQA
jgi:hypothetical protein